MVAQALQGMLRQCRDSAGFRKGAVKAGASLAQKRRSEELGVKFVLQIGNQDDLANSGKFERIVARKGTKEYIATAATSFAAERGVAAQSDDGDVVARRRM